MSIETKQVDTPAKNKGSNKLLFGIYVLFLLFLGVGMIFLFSKEFSGSRPSNDVSFPSKGTLITIEGATSIWRKVQESDVVSEGIQIIPEVTIQINPKSKGRLIAFFRDEEDNTVGDPISLDFSEGDLSPEQSALTLACTTGYAARSNFRSYLFSKAPYWSLTLKESTPEGVTELCRIAIPPNDLHTP